jgi:ABC-type dipeptide/oligopeptide/nickel transport system permease subunit
MKHVRYFACAMLMAIAISSLAAELFAPAGYATQFREVPNSTPSRQHLLGTDELGRDRFSRVLYGTRVSLLLAPAAALLATLLAVLVGGVAGWMGGWCERLALGMIDLVLSLPWLFLLLAVRAMLPLNVSPITSVMVTFLLLGLLGWAASARVLCAGARSLRTSDFVLHARASGVRRLRLLAVHVVPNLKPVLFAQFWISVPVFIVSEANLGILGLGVAEPMPSWGSLLRELESFTSLGAEPWKLVPLLLLVMVVSSFQIILSRQEVPA